MLKCQSSCPLADPQSYIWYSNEHIIVGQTYQFYLGRFPSTNRISCAVKGHEDSPSPSVLVKDSWDVTYSSTQICAFKGSTVKMYCSYTYPLGRSVNETFWFSNRKDDEYVRLKDDPQYAGRVEYDQKRCSLTIRNLTESDSAEYKFRFITDPQEQYMGSPGVTLSVKDPQLQVHVSRSVNQFSTWTELTCQSSCQRSDNSSFNWYNNSLKVQEGKRYLYLQTFGPSDSYYCAVQGQERFRSHAVYAPKLPSVSVSPSAEIVEGSSVNLTCSSDANPAANYSWYKENQDSPKASGQIFTITDFRAEHSGKYSCEAQNIFGRQTVSVHVTVWADKSTNIMNIIKLTLVVLMLIPLFVLSLWTRKKTTVNVKPEQNEAVEMMELDSHDYENDPALKDVTAAQTDDTEEQEDLE
ncbi:carcinoembryonic antigen-related cell adhesion molecule 5-like isoform X2 [Acanthochromis polyacanthus]|uniref:carcinoembryonic antigen-related cell adhesion molecule 5-like isoform X1 n=1 Tax=Acanthochromis polyacanthus TaxID=80966 RepID=UPI0022346940|nr:carcinoembryonic antigen-related cell adhesion molecule 5-like isoform X1 [Acanthochromis polyacanthus]XP_051802060.1 carcinoembryonic antigen-related cell adhesion molecule 5-like isoform X2 [Acanthochromis polyacanthus]